MLFLAFGSLLADRPFRCWPPSLAVGAGDRATVGLLSHAVSINSITPSVAALIGIGVAVDYALFVVTRHRHPASRAGLSPEDAAVTALATSGRAVVFAGATVAIAMLGLLVLNVDFLTGVGLAAAIHCWVRGPPLHARCCRPLFSILGVRVLQSSRALPPNQRRHRRRKRRRRGRQRNRPMGSVGRVSYNAAPVLLSCVALDRDDRAARWPSASPSAPWLLRPRQRPVVIDHPPGL